MGSIDMLYIPKSQQLAPEDTNGREPTQNGYGIALNVLGTAAGYGAYTEIGYTCIEPSYGMLVNIQGVSLAGNKRKAAINIAYGQPGSETIAVRNLLCSARGGGTTGNTSIYLPLYTPPFTPVSISFSWVGTGVVPIVTADVTFISGSSTADATVPSFQNCDTYGVPVFNTPEGTVVTSGATAGAFGTPVAIGIPVNKAYKAVLLIPGAQDLADLLPSTVYARLMFGTDVSSITHTVAAVQTDDDRVVGPLPGFPTIINIPSGTALNVDMATSNATAVTMDWIVCCFH